MRGSFAPSCLFSDMKRIIYIIVAALLISAVIPGAAFSCRSGGAGAAADTLKVNTTNLAADVEGFNGPTPVEISVVKGKITRIRLLPNQETPAFLQSVIDAGLLKALDGKTVEDASKVKLDAVSGATYSSKAIIENIRRGLDTLK